MPRTGNTFTASREILATPEQVFAAFTDPVRHARWWGPDGFTNTFKSREFKAGGRWIFTMHGPKGQNFPNESVFEEVSPTKIVIRHESGPQYRLIIGLEKSQAGTLVSWSQTFDKLEIAENIEKLVIPANDQNLERLSSEVLGRP